MSNEQTPPAMPDEGVLREAAERAVEDQWNGEIGNFALICIRRGVVLATFAREAPPPREGAPLPVHNAELDEMEEAWKAENDRIKREHSLIGSAIREASLEVARSAPEAPAAAGSVSSGVREALLQCRNALAWLHGGTGRWVDPGRAIQAADEALTREEAPREDAGDVAMREADDWTQGRAWPDLLEDIANYWAEWEENRAGRGTYTPEELAEDAGEFANGLANHLAALASSPAGTDERRGA